MNSNEAPSGPVAFTFTRLRSSTGASSAGMARMKNQMPPPVTAIITQASQRLFKKVFKLF